MKSILACAALAFLTGCLPLGTYYKPGVEVARKDRDLMNCKVSGAQKVPVSQRTRIIPGPYYPSRQICDSDEKCYTIPGHYGPDQVEIYDANAPLREQVVAQCMTDGGYERVKIPHCKANIRVAPGQTKVFPKLTPTSCVIRQNGQWQIVDPGK
ncbi:MAG: hypothetical protein CSA70_08515 [Rhodobacterales bacterium]|nr:MAG: hypothetical protein CSA70_08515 [Rhodobacterales bacterium]